MMRITCPQCGFFRELPDNKVPVTSTMATCPKCRHRFRFRPELTAPQRDARFPELRDDTQSGSGTETVSSWRRPGPAAARARQAESLAEEQAEETRRTLAETPEQQRSEAAPDAVSADPASAARSELPPTRPPEHAAPVEPPQEPDASRWPEEEDLPLPPEDAFGPRQTPPPAPQAREAAPEDLASATPEPDETATPSRPEPAASADDAAACAPESDSSAPAPKNRRKILDKDGVRDIWARLQAMDDRPRSRRKADKPDAEPDAELDADKADSKAAESEPQATDPIPWERLDIYGFLPGLGLTLRQILLSPGAFFAAMPEGRPKGKALVFNLLISEFLLVLDFLWSLFGLRAKWAETGNTDFVGAVTTSPGLGFLLALLLVPPVLSLGVYLDAWLTHLLLLLFRSAKKGFPETFRVLCYSAAPTMLSAVPVAGQLLSPVILVWYMAVQAIGLTKVHQGALTQTLAAVFIKWSLYLFLLLAMLQSISPGQ